MQQVKLFCKLVRQSNEALIVWAAVCEGLDHSGVKRVSMAMFLRSCTWTPEKSVYFMSLNM